MHDKTMAELAGDTLPPGSGLYQDMGLQLSSVLTSHT
jgi:hypothetical protein